MQLLLDALEQCGFDGDFFTVIAHGVLEESDVFPFAIFQINATEKPIDMSAPSVREMVVPEDILLADFVARTAPIGGRIRRLEFNLGR